jgi:CubicO group peptidase (beta-lactamase class C family)
VFKRLGLALSLVPLLILALLWLLAGISPRQLPAAAALATGLGAKLTCSGQYVSGFDATRNANDLASYSALTRLLSLQPVPQGGVTASLLGSPAAEARYRPGLGCTLEYGTGSVLDAVAYRPKVSNVAAPWPAGNAVGPADPKIESLLTAMLAADNLAGRDTRALLVVQDGRILGEAYAPGITTDTPLLGWSMGKSVTAILLGRLQALGKLTVDERKLFPAWAGDERAAISVENMLQMSSGLDFSEDYVPGSDSTRMLFMSPSASDTALESPLAHTPGQFFAYSSGTTNLLAQLVYERVGASPQALMDFIAREIAEPLGLQATTFELDASGVFVGSSFLYAPARDWARFGYLLVNGGEINGQRLLTADWMAHLTQPNHSDNEPRYGYQVWLNGGGRELRWPSLPPSAYAMQGNREQVVMLLPSLRGVVVRLGWSAGEYPVDANFLRIVAELGSEPTQQLARRAL